MGFVPRNATVALFMPHLGGALFPAVLSVERMAGPEAARAFLRRAPLPYLALEASEGGAPRGIDPQGGLGIFRVPGFDGWIGAVGVVDPPRVVDDLAEGLGIPKQGRTELRPGKWLLRPRKGPPLEVLARQGVLYLLMPRLGGPAERTGRSSAALVDGASFGAAEDALGEAGGRPLESSPRFRALQKRVKPGQVYLFAASTDPDDVWDAAVLSGQVEEGRAALDGFIACRRPLFQPGGSGGTLPFLKAAPASPFLVASVNVAPDELLSLLFGPVGTERRGLAEQGLGEEEIDLAALSKGLRPPLGLLGYLDSRELMRRMVVGEGAGPVFVFRAQARPSRQPGDLRALMESAGAEEVRLRNGWLEVGTSKLPPGRRTEDLLARYGQLLPPGAFGPGHVTVVLDLRPLRTGGRAVQGPAGDALEDQLLAALVERQTEVDWAFLDGSADEGGIRLAGEVRFPRARAVARPHASIP